MSIQDRTSSPRAASPRALALSLASCLLAAHAGCGGSAEDDGDDGETDGAPSFTSIYRSSTFQQCAECHAPSAPGRTAGIESTEDWSTRDSAYATLKSGRASGLIGNYEACNGVPLIGPTAEQSLLVAALDFDVRQGFESPSAPDCNADTISDMTAKLGEDLPPALLQQLKDWIDQGAPNN